MYSTAAVICNDFVYDLVCALSLIHAHPACVCMAREVRGSTAFSNELELCQYITFWGPRLFTGNLILFKHDSYCMGALCGDTENVISER